MSVESAVIKDLIQSYKHTLDVIEEDLPEHPYSNSFLKGKYLAYCEVVNDLTEILEDTE